MKRRTRNLLKSLLDFLLPPRKDELSLRDISPTEVTGRLSEARIENEAALFNYRNDFVRACIWELKFHQNRMVLRELAKFLFDALLERVSERIVFGEEERVLLVPIPASNARLKERGFNGVELLVKEILDMDKEGLFEDGSAFLKKVKEVPRQTEIKNREERIRNVIGVFGVTYPEKVNGRAVFLIDDITTTGATLAEAKEVLYVAGAREVECFTLAH